MWTMTKIGFFSAVQHRDAHTDVLVRARSRTDLEALIGFADELGLDLAGPMATEPVEIVGSTGHADYPWRIRITKVLWKLVLMELVDLIDYDNFKSAIGKSNPARARTYHNVWDDLLAIERESAA